ncbi:multiple organellar RNA editing factor 3 mitochondrial [Prunus yedoensis var. nudiflora]|uniref:Multiple organellar RNA editing factor 3 mitochondrial n=1 Tax=Prunus yedoensis var. nudiflora TaxID=2094558 RepID=A0A314YSR2_PRUYE|nr:multiple organellar RNA editing factor 3 mitochondrial [Prunus yedoensis var. nudiflora]
MAYAAARRTLASALTRTLASTHTCTKSSFSSRSRFAVALLNKQQTQLLPDLVNITTRSKHSGQGYSPLNDATPNWSNRPPKETILLDGCDYEHWLIVMEYDDPKPSEGGDDQFLRQNPSHRSRKILMALGFSEEEAKKKIYSVSTSTYTGFGALISEELSLKVKGLPGVLWVLPDSYLDVPNKDYGGDLYIDGKVIPRPQYRYNERQQQTRNRPRPRYDRRRETMQVERREPMQGQSLGQDRREPVQQTTQSSAQGGGTGSTRNQGEFNGGNV